jgi:hypothetical protein
MTEKYKLKFVKNNGKTVLLREYQHNKEHQTYYPSEPVSLNNQEERDIVSGLEEIMKKLNVDEFIVEIKTRKMKTRVNYSLE